MCAVNKVTIIGGGIGGLCTAIALRQAGMQAEVYEQADTQERVGAGIVLWSNAMKVLQHLGLADEVSRCGRRLQRGEFRTQDGKILASTQTGEMEQRYGAATIAIHRADLHACLLAALPKGTVHLSETCSGYIQEAGRVRATFSSGRSAEGDLLVGADGLHSVIRRHLLPRARPRYAGYLAWRGVAESREQVEQGISFETWGCGLRFGQVRVNDRQIYWFATANSPPGSRQTSGQRREQLLRLYGGWHDPIPWLIEATPPEAILLNDIDDLDPLPHWSQGWVTLLGDAAHATTPNMGQGACQAIESSLVLAYSLAAGPDVHTALQRYEALRRPRSTWITRQSRQIGQVGQVANPLLCRLRNRLLSLAPPGLLINTLSKAAGYDAYAAVQAATT